MIVMEFMMNVVFAMVMVWCLEGNISFGSLTETHLDILYDSPLDIGGYQFSVTGIDIINAYGGISGRSGFNIANNNDTVIAFSPRNSLIPIMVVES